MSVIIRKLNTLIRNPRRAIGGKFRPYQIAKAKAYLDREGATAFLTAGAETEIKPQWMNLAILHRHIRTRRPPVVLEFGVGFSTIAMAHAVAANGFGHLWTVDTSEKWIENVRGKLGKLGEAATLTRSDVRVTSVGGQFCHLFEKIPNVVPDLVYLDGPNPRDALGEINGLTFIDETGANRSVIAADLILLESTLPQGCKIVIDGRMNNSTFLRANFKRKWRWSFDPVHKIRQVQLLD